MWALRSSYSESELRFIDEYEVLNAHGVFRLPSLETGMSQTLRLLINDTARNNGTEIFCSDANDDEILFETSLYVYAIGGSHSTLHIYIKLII